MLRISEWQEFSTLDTIEPRLAYAMTVAHAFSAYLSGDTDLGALREQITSKYLELRREGLSCTAASSAIRRELDRGAAHAAQCENVYRFNAIHDELRGWIDRLCTDEATRYRARGDGRSGSGQH